MTEHTCGCSDKCGPCEQHEDVLAICDTDIRISDELIMELINDLLALGAELSEQGWDERDRLMEVLNASRSWFDDPDDARAAVDLMRQLEAELPHLWVTFDDGYKIVQPSPNCPLLTS